PSWNSTSSGRFARLPEYVNLSSTTTSSPLCRSRLTKCEPMKPAPPVTRTRIVRRLVRRGGKQAGERPGHPPVPAAEEAHRGRDDHEADERRVEENRDGEPEAELLERRRACDGERREHGDHHGGGARDDARGAHEPLGDGALVVPVRE